MHQKCLSILLIIACVLVTGCALWGPSYTKPNTDIPESFVSQDALSMKQSALESKRDRIINLAWWEQLHDPELNSLVESAIKSNTNIQQAIGNIIQANGALQQVEAAWIPTVGVSPGYKQTGTYSGSNANGAVSNLTIGGNAGYFLNFSPSYTLNIMQQLRSQEAAKANVSAAKFAKDAIRITIIGQVAGSYVTLRGYDYMLSLQKTLVEDTKNQYELGKAQYKEGYISLLTLQNYQQQYQAAKAQIPIIENNIVSTRNAIRVLVNKNPGDINRGISFDKLPMDGLIPSNLPSEVLQNRPDILQAESQLIAANANIGVATSTFFPSISLTGSTGSAASSLSQLFQLGSDFWLGQIALNMPILNFTIYGQIKSARGAYYTAYYNYIQAVRTAFSQVDNGLSGHDKLIKSYKEQQQVYDSTNVAFDLGNQRFKDGADSYVTLLTYKINLDNAALSLANLKVQQLQTIVQLYQALAAGVNVGNSDSPNIKFGDGRDI